MFGTARFNDAVGNEFFDLLADENFFVVRIAVLNELSSLRQLGCFVAGVVDGVRSIKNMSVKFLRILDCASWYSNEDCRGIR